MKEFNLEELINEATRIANSKEEINSSKKETNAWKKEIEDKLIQFSYNKFSKDEYEYADFLHVFFKDYFKSLSGGIIIPENLLTFLVFMLMSFTYADGFEVIYKGKNSDE